MAINRIEQAQDVVRMAEKGELHWMDALMGPGSGDAFNDIPTTIDRFGEMYARVRITEASAYRFKDEGDVPERRLIEHRVAEMRGQRESIIDLQNRLDEMTQEELAELGRFFAKQQCQWALGVVDRSFETWGY